MRIDAHQHFWSLARGDYGWLTPALGPIYRDFGPADLAPLLAAQGIERTILVQAAPTEAETAYLLDIAGKTPFVAGVVGWTDFDASDAVKRITALADDPLLVGLRPMVQDIPDDDWLARPQLSPAFKAMIANGLVFDALLKPRHIAAMLAMLERHPTLTCVIDHGAKPDLVTGDLAGWRDGMSALAEHSRLACKLSGLVTEAGPDWTLETLRPVVDHLLASFGPERLIFGSDWPVVMLRASYGQWIEAAEALLSDLTKAQRAAVFGGNARKLYLSQRGRQ
ncbi:Amidohydrolase [Bosea sp. 62]|uniref:amidohydrolase family protein n=1 Tax=unclassified Bosea (in: a-proteobacteria) TaxID=2653178 RepID=UPI001254C095|nr:MULTISPECIES: amidohydrolase family protein [unclassified Bosea (in: a-proteobacteria)]CAD5252935.1 Amidohydrolase [Bosea sp. 46]CAD5257596.1 Amidohydrolase [Bosea sp. 21B]CAD5283337.1 Amidohydrolase [Bosea sp. 7B]VVT52202.1 Amidohydrolase [Bosea sp. EC-HK365B]VXB37108.1 Amidohydrolase [Bosea sp. 29B]